MLTLPEKRELWQILDDMLSEAEAENWRENGEYTEKIQAISNE